MERFSHISQLRAISIKSGRAVGRPAGGQLALMWRTKDWKVVVSTTR